MSESRLRFLSQFRSSIFPQSSDDSNTACNQNKKNLRGSDNTSYECRFPRSQTPTSSYFKPQDHSLAGFTCHTPRVLSNPNQKSSSTLLKKSQRLYTFDKIATQHLDETLHSVSNKNLLPWPFSQTTPRITPFTKLKPSKAEDPFIESISISGLKPSDNNSTIKNLCKGLHIIQINTSIDNLTGNCLGNATLQIRADANKKDLEKLKISIFNKGYQISAVASVRGKKNQLCNLGTNFLNHLSENKENPLSSCRMSSRERKRAVLATSDDLFGNSPGTGRDCKISSGYSFKEIKADRENLRIWENTRNCQDRRPARFCINNTGSTRPTLPSRCKDLF
ncbi:hypothetical protein SteCoe_14193 [Stentor coeruleus]|uniref:Uncharacterized protein n=1 Tax=Stentor coeruleus TaxID=5963 RepID=A0A1R2C6S0_9CILI|nr:hypothetical protein SteCoe_14193 [Stentor coeruleus]